MAKVHKMFVFRWTDKLVFNLGDSVLHSTTQTTQYCRPWTQKVWDGSIVSTFSPFFWKNLEQYELNFEKLIYKTYRLHSKKILPHIWLKSKSSTFKVFWLFFNVYLIISYRIERIVLDQNYMLFVDLFATHQSAKLAMRLTATRLPSLNKELKKSSVL